MVPITVDLRASVTKKKKKNASLQSAIMRVR